MHAEEKESSSKNTQYVPRNHSVVRKVGHFFRRTFCFWRQSCDIMGCNLDKVQSTEAAGDVHLPVSEKLQKGIIPHLYS